jgi:hypothetical protein
VIVASISNNSNSGFSRYIPSGWQALSTSFFSDGRFTIIGNTPYTFTLADSSGGALFDIAGAGQPPSSSITFTQAQLAAGLVFLEGTRLGTDTLSISVYDASNSPIGNVSANLYISAGPDTPFTISSKNTVATVQSSLNQGGTFLADLLNFTGSSAAMNGVQILKPQALKIYDSGTSPDSGHLTYQTYSSGVSSTVNVGSGVVASLTGEIQASSVKYVASNTPGSIDTIYVSAYDGFTWSGWFSWNQVSGTNAFPPPVLGQASSLTAYVPNGWSQLSSNFLIDGHITDANGQPMAQGVSYRLIDNGALTFSASGAIGLNSANSNAQFYYNGPIPSGSANGGLTFSPSDLVNGLVYLRGVSEGSDQLSIQMFDGKSWSNAVNFNLTVRAADTPLTMSQLTVNSASNLNGGSPLNTLVRFSNARGDAIQQLQFYDTAFNPDGGYFTWTDSNGPHSTQPGSGQVVTLTSPAQIASLKYVGSPNVNADSPTQSENLYFNAYDGYTWSGWSSALVTTGTGGPIQNPVITGINSALMTSDTTPVKPLGTVVITDPNGSTQTETVTVSFATANGALTTLGAGTLSSNGANTVYTVTGSAAAVTTALDNLVFTPTAHQTPNGQNVSTSFTIVDIDTSQASTSNSNTLVTVTTASNPSINNVVNTPQNTTDAVSINPFSTIQIVDPNLNQSETVTVTLSAAANGTLSTNSTISMAGVTFTPNATTGVYTLSGSLNNVNAVLDGLIFTPTAHLVGIGQAVATSFAITDSDTFGGSAIPNSNTVVIATAVPTPRNIPQSAPTASDPPFKIQAVAGVGSWVASFAITPAGLTTYTKTVTLNQDSAPVGGSISNANIGFLPNLTLQVGDAFTVTLTGYAGANGTGNVSVPSGTFLSTNFFTGLTLPASTTSLKVQFIGYNAAGTLIGAPASYSATDQTLYLIKGMSSTQLSSLLSTNATLLSYLKAGHLADISMTDYVDPALTQNPVEQPLNMTITPTGGVSSTVSVPLLSGGGNVDNWNPMALKAATNITVLTNMSIAGGNSWTSNTNNLTANKPQAFNIYNLTNYAPNGGVPGMAVQIYFTYTDSNGNALTAAQITAANVQLTTLPASGQLLGTNDWLPVAAHGSSQTPLTIYSGTVAYVLSQVQNAAFDSLFYITDTTANITNASASNAHALYQLVVTGKLIGATPTDGFTAMPNSANDGNTYLSVLDPTIGKTAYIRTDRTQAQTAVGEKAYSQIAIQTTNANGGLSANTSVTLYDSTAGVVLATLVTDSNGLGNVTLPTGLAFTGTHTLVAQVTGASAIAKIGIVPPGGGMPTFAANGNLSVWVGTVAQLPTGSGDIVPNTLYVINDTVANIVALDSLASSNTAVLANLMNKGYIAYNSPNLSVTWAQLFQWNSNQPLSQIGSQTVTDNVYALAQHVYSNGDTTQSYAIADSASRLLAQAMVGEALAISQGNSSSWLRGSSLQGAVDNHQVTWSDSLGNLLNPQNIGQISAVYFGPGKLAGVQIQDTLANLSQVSNPAQIASLLSFVNNANLTAGHLTLDIRDSVANLYGALLSNNPNALEAKLNSIFSQDIRGNTTYLSTRIEINDSVSSLTTAATNGQLSQLITIANNNFLHNINPSVRDTGLVIRITDTASAIDTFINNNPLAAQVSAFTVQDTASAILAAMTNGHGWNSSTSIADNIVVQDTYAGIQTNLSALLANHDYSAQVSKFVFTDVTGASAATPLVITGTNSSLYGQFPQLDFSQAKGLQGILSATESELSNKSGVALTISDSNGHQVVVNLVASTYTGATFYDPNQLLLNNLILSNAPLIAGSATLDPVSNAPFLITGNKTVTTWQVTQTHTVSGAVADTQIISIKQDTSGGNIGFAPNINPNPGDTYTYTISGLNAAGTVVAGAGQIGFNKPSPNLSTTMTLSFASIANGVITGLPAYSANTVVLLVGSASLTDLQTALTGNTVLAQYANNYQLGLGALSNYVQGSGISSVDPFISINGQNIWMIGGNLGAYNPMAINWQAPAGSTSTTTTTVNESITISNGVTGSASSSSQISNYNSSFGLNANTPKGLSQWSWNLTSNINVWANGLGQPPVINPEVINVAFTNTGGGQLQVANMPVVTGGLLSGNNWSNVGTSGGNLTIYDGNLSYILGVVNALSQNNTTIPSNTVFYINDTIENIQSSATANQLYQLIQGGKILGASFTDGIAALSQMGSEGFSNIAVKNSAGQTAYIHQTESGSWWYGQMQHSVLALNTTLMSGNATTVVTVKIDGLTIATTTIGVNGVSNLVLPKFSNFIGSLTTGNSHTLTLTTTNGATVGIGVVPVGGGYPASYSNATDGIKLWIGTAAQLPTSISDIAPNTLYVINDTGQNLLALDGYNAVDTAVINSLAASGYLAYNSTSGMGWSEVHQLQQTNSNAPIANISNVLITDTAFVLENHFWDANAGQSFGIRDTGARLLNSNFISLASSMSAGNGNIPTNNMLLSAFATTLTGANTGHNQVNWVDTIANTNNGAMLLEMSSVYYGSGQLASVSLRDTVANWNNVVATPSLVSNVLSYAGNTFSGTVMVDIQDTAANIVANLVTASPLTLEANLQQIFTNANVKSLVSRIEINDSVQSIEAISSTVMNSLVSVANQFFTNPGTSNYGFDFRVTDSVAAINAFLNNSQYTYLSSKVSSYIVQDTASSIANSINNQSWASATNTANNIVVKDSFNNIVTNEAGLFAGNNNGGNGEATKLIFTDISGASATNPLIINGNYSSNGQMPQLDFSQAGLLTGAVTVTESVLSSSQLTALTTGKGYSVTGGANYGVQLTITDAASHTVVVDVLSNWSQNALPDTDLTNSDMLSIYLNSANTQSRVFNLSANMMTSNPNGGSTIGNNLQNVMSVYNWSASDKITYTETTGVLATVGAATYSGAGAGNQRTVSINNTGLATMNNADMGNIGSQVLAVENAILLSNPTSGTHKMAYWQNGNDTYMLITDGSVHNPNQISQGDDLVKLVGVNASAHTMSTTGGIHG